MPRLVSASVPLLPVTFAMAAGILCGASGWAVPLVACSLAMAAVLMYCRHTYMTIITCAVTLGSIEAMLLIPGGGSPEFENVSDEFHAIVKDIKDSRSGQRALVEVDSYVAYDGQSRNCRPTPVSVYIPGFTPEIRETDRIVFRGRIEPIRVSDDIPDQLDYSRFLLSRGIFGQILLSPDSITSVTPSGGWRALALSIRHKAEDIVFSMNISQGTKLFIASLITGDTSILPEDDYRNMRNAGIAHILAISGLHVAIIAFWAGMLLWPLCLVGYGKARVFILMCVIWAFAVVSGLSPSVIRASVFATVILGGRLLERKTSAYNSLCLAALIIMVVDPESLFNIGFQLSFAAVAGILAFASALNPVPVKRKVVHGIVGMVTVSVGATLGTAAITMYHFHTFPLYFIVANLAVSMILPFVFGVAILLGTMVSAGLHGDMLCTVLDWMCGRIFVVSDTLASMAGAHVDNIYIPAYSVLVYVLALIALKLYVDRGRTYWAVGSVVALCSFVFIAYGGNHVERKAAMHFLRGASHTDIVIDDGLSDFITLLSTSKTDLKSDVYERVRWQLTDYMGKRGIDSIAFVDGIPGLIVLPDGKRVAVECGNGVDSRYAGIDYLVVCHGFHGNMAELLARTCPDTVVFSADMNPKLATRYIHDVKLPVIDMRGNPFRIIIGDRSGWIPTR